MMVDNILTLEKMLELPNRMIETSEKYNEYSTLLSKNVREVDDIKDKKDYIMNQLDRFNDMKYLLRFPVEYRLKLNSNMEQEIVSNNRTNTDKVSNIVISDALKKEWATEFYNSLMVISMKLTEAESKYFVWTFFAHKSEDRIAEGLDVSRNYLQSIKKSCIIKVWSDLKKFDNNFNESVE